MGVLTARLFQPDDHQAVAEFNQRLAGHPEAEGFRLGENPPPALPDPPPAVHLDHYLLLDGAAVRGGFMLQKQPFWLAGASRPVNNIQMPVTEGLVDRKYAALGMLLVRLALQENPLLFALGMGSREQRFPRLLEAMGWRIRSVPFLFRVHKARRFLQEIEPLRRTPARRVLAQVAAWSGAGAVAIHGMQSRTIFRFRRGVSVEVEALNAWPEWVDSVWDEAKSGCSMAGMRTRENLDALYPLAASPWAAYACRHNGRAVGWLVLLATQMREHKHFGNLRVGTVLDGLAIPGFEDAVADAARGCLEESGVELALTNQAHRNWIGAFRRSGFLTGPSNYLLATSPELSEFLDPPAELDPLIHMTRGDGDGRIHL